MTRWLETDSLTNQDISSALAIGAYTADADRLVLVQWYADAVSGNGDYVCYLTHQIAGAGSHYRYIPITTAAAASGVTAIAGQSLLVAVRSGDVLTVYLDGLAGDTTTPDTTVRWFELAALRPTTADRTLLVDASGQVTAGALADGAITAAAIATGAIDADALAADAGTEIGTAVWASSTRTLTQTAASVTDAVTGSALTITRGDTWTASLTGLADMTGRSKVWFAVKASKNFTDAQAILLIELAAGLTVVNGAAYTTTTNGSITIDSSTALTVVVKPAVTSALTPAAPLYYEVQMLEMDGSVHTLTAGECRIEADVIRAIA